MPATHSLPSKTSGATSKASKKRSSRTIQSDDVLSTPRRVRMACASCQMKKIKCNTNYPCQQCQNNGLICRAGIRKVINNGGISGGYSRILEESQAILNRTIQALYEMVREGREWDLEEPDITLLGVPVIHDIAQSLGCMVKDEDIQPSICPPDCYDQSTNPDYLGSPSFPDLGGIGKAASVAIDLKISLRPTIFALATSQQQGSQLRLEKHCEQHVETQHCECSPMAVQWPVAIPEFCCSHNDVPSNYLYPSEALGGVDEFWGQLPFCTADYI